MPGSDPRKHHYQPKGAVLRNFTDRRGQLHFWRRGFQHDDIKTASPDSLFRRNDLNALYDEKGRRDVSVELFLGKVDDRSAGVVSKIVRAARKGEAAQLDLDDWASWVELIYYLFTRSPFISEGLAGFLGIDGSLEGLLSLLEEQEGPMDAATKQELLTDPRSQHVWSNAVVSRRAKPPSEDVLDAFRQRGIVVFAFPPGSLIVGDIPMATVEFVASAGMRSLAVPVAHDVAFGVSAEPMTLRYHPMPATEADLLNRAVARHSNMIAGRTANRVLQYTREPYVPWAPTDLARE